MRLVKKKKKYLYKKPLETEEQSFICMSSFCWGLIISIPASISFLLRAELSQASSCRPLCQVIDMQQRVRGEELLQSTHTGYIPTKAWQRAG